MRKLSAERARQGIVEYTGRLAGAAVAAGPEVIVPTAPEWTVTQLVEHVGQTQHWVAEIIERRISDPTQLPAELAVPPAGAGEWQAWLGESARRVAEACSDEALDAAVFNAAGDERTGAQFWMTSMLNESVVHGFDAAGAGGSARAEIDGDIAAALIGNHLAMLTSPTWELQRPASAQAIRGTGQTLQWQATDDAGAWFVERRPGGAIWQAGTGQADVTVTGPAGSLLLAMTRRLPLRDAGGICIDGDIDVAQHWLDNTAHVTN